MECRPCVDKLWNITFLYTYRIFLSLIIRQSNHEYQTQVQLRVLFLFYCFIIIKVYPFHFTANVMHHVDMLYITMIVKLSKNKPYCKVADKSVTFCKSEVLLRDVTSVPLEPDNTVSQSKPPFPLLSLWEIAKNKAGVKALMVGCWLIQEWMIKSMNDQINDQSLTAMDSTQV